MFKVWHFLSIRTSEFFIQALSLSLLDYCSISFSDLGKRSLRRLTGSKRAFAGISPLQKSARASNHPTVQVFITFC